MTPETGSNKILVASGLSFMEMEGVNTFSLSLLWMAKDAVSVSADNPDIRTVALGFHVSESPLLSL